MYVCMYVRYRFTIEIYGFMHSLRTFMARAVHDAIVRNVNGVRGLGGQKSSESRDMEDG